MKHVSVSRRQFLRGSSGVVVGLPFLPSLLPGPAYGVTYALVPQKRFVAFATAHGAIDPNSMYPAASTLTDSKTILTGPDHVVKFGKLVASNGGGTTQVSAVLKAASSKLTDRLVGKMNVLRGFDIPYYIGHHTGGHLGNYVRSDQGPQNLTPWPTIDQAMAWSSSFYPDLTGVKTRSMVTGLDFGGLSFAWSNPQAKSGTIQKVAVQTSSGGLFMDVFGSGGGGSTPAPVAPRPAIVDKVLASYKALRQSNRRLSADDRQRLDDHMARLAELQRKLAVSPGASTPKTCTKTAPAQTTTIKDDNPGAAGAVERHGLLNDVLAMGLACGASRVATIHVHYPFHDYGGSWHQDVAHQWPDPAKQAMLVQGLQRTFEGAILDLAAKLDAIDDAPGVSVLDNTMLQWTQESGWSTHDAQDMPIVTFGGAGGSYKTGLFVDYRNTGRSTAHLDVFGQQKQFCGLWLRQWQAAVLQAMGVPRAEFERNGRTGYGDPFWSSGYDKAVHPDVINKASDPIPIITA
jgi:hypothetical protein